jgi:hypothetical protein
MYTTDALEVNLSGAVTASSIVSVDSRFTVTLAGITSSASAYQIQVSNINPHIKVATPTVTGTGLFTSGGDDNRYPVPENIAYSVNPKLEASWVTLTAFNVAGYVIVDGCFRLMRIMKTTGFDAGAKAYVFAEKLSPVIQ